MKAIIIFLGLLLIIFAVSPKSQTNNTNYITGKSDAITYQNGTYATQFIFNPGLIQQESQNDHRFPVQYQSSSVNNSATRWSFIDTYCIGDFCQTSGNGLYQVVGWNLNPPERVSLYGNSGSAPIWEYNAFVSPNYYNHVAISDTGGVIACGSYNNICMFNRTSSTPFFNFSLGTDTAGPVAITNNGNFIVASMVKQTDTSTIYGFSKDSGNYVWRYKLPAIGTGGSLIYGIKISGNDSLVMINNYGGFVVLRTYTGQVVYQGTNSGTQAPQGISGNGNIIATINYSGYLKVYQWNGNSYNMLWQYQEPPGIYYNWMYSVDVSNDGSMVACGTFNFVTSQIIDGNVRLFRVANGPTPVWSYLSAGDAVPGVAFSKNGNILAAITYADVGNTKPDLLVFKLSSGANVPIFTLNTPGSPYWVSVSNDGTTIMISGKKVPIRTPGFTYGGEAYNVFIDTNDSPLGIIANNEIPESFSLEQNYPNPFNPVTMINYSITNNGPVKLSVFDALGREVLVLVDKMQNKGRYSVELNAEKLGSGVYFYRLSSGENTQTKKLVLIK